LQEAANLTTPIGWTNVPGVTGNTYTTPVGANNSKFYRLLVSP
jgi:hypothetical protein